MLTFVSLNKLALPEANRCLICVLAARSALKTVHKISKRQSFCLHLGREGAGRQLHGVEHEVPRVQGLGNGVKVGQDPVFTSVRFAGVFMRSGGPCLGADAAVSDGFTVFLCAFAVALWVTAGPGVAVCLLVVMRWCGGGGGGRPAVQARLGPRCLGHPAPAVSGWEVVLDVRVILLPLRRNSRPALFLPVHSKLIAKLQPAK